MYAFRFTAIENITATMRSINESVRSVKQTSDNLKKSFDVLPKSIVDLKKDMDSLAIKRDNAFDVKELKQYNSEIQAIQNNIKHLSGMTMAPKVPTPTGSGGGAGAGLMGMLGGAAMPLMAVTAGIGAISAVASGIKSAIAEPLNEFKALNETVTLLKMKLGDVKAPQAMKELADFADKMGKPVKDVQDVYLNLVNRGMTPTMNQMRQLADFATVAKKPIDQLMEALLDGEMSEFERMKEFGVKFKVQGNQLAVTYNKQTKMIKNDSDSVRSYLLGLGDLDGVKGASEKLGAGLAGNQVRMENSLLRIKQQLGSIFEPFANAYYAIVNPVLKMFNDFFDNNLGSIKDFKESVTSAFSTIKAFVMPIFEGLKPIAVGFFNVFKNGFLRIKGIINDNKEGISAIGKVLGWVRDIGIKITQLHWAKLIVVFDVVANVITFVARALMKMYGDIAKAIIEVANLFKEFTIYVTTFFDWIGLKTMSFLDGLFPGFRKAFNSIKDWLYDSFIKPLVEAFGKLFSFDTYTKTIADSEDNYRSGDWNDENRNDNTYLGRKKAQATKGIGVSNKLDDIQSKDPKHVNITIHKLVERLELHSINMEIGANKIKEEITRILLDAVNDVNHAI